MPQFEVTTVELVRQRITWHVTADTPEEARRTAVERCGEAEYVGAEHMDAVECESVASVEEIP